MREEQTVAQWNRSAMRAFAPSLGAWVFAMLVAWLAFGAQARADHIAWTRWLVPLAWAGVAASIVIGGIVSWRLWRIDASKGLICECGGLLGPVRHRRMHRVRRCRACGTHWRCTDG